ncbi:MAG TPA: helix-turn-helix transcriptional regulator [Amycolatopsis sp.]|uniref:helix-turn-helix domain-containing protein n=1 Tax=Amycolatopsis sp. TaxID=37632 RepID=UPI002B46D712|nr:helix-turn-helix transcriptional regulator [Amycolatopsis sp.]HKS43651.1 helix-turn-helix transcriptional regulator [Amycolatopsis sp.]
MSTFAEEYGKRVNTARTVAGLTQTELGARVDLTRSSIANIEAGRQSASAEQVIEFAEAMRCDPRWLLTGWPPGRPTVLAPRQDMATAAANLRKIANMLDASEAPEDLTEGDR